MLFKKYRDNIPIGNYLFVFDDQLKREPVGFALLTGRNDFAGRASHLEICMFTVVADKQSKSIGKNMFSSIIEATTGYRHSVYLLP